MTDLDEMSLEKFRLWSLNALRVFLSVRKKSITGNFDELVARAFSAWEENIPVDVLAEQRQKSLLAEYKAKLVVEGETLDDPLEIQTGWTGEKEGIIKWPSVYFIDISRYLNGKNPEDLMEMLLNEYKVGKAYRYFTAEWVKEVFYHDNNSSDKCLVKAKVTPSQAVNNKPYEVWMVIRKDDGETPGGQILSAYCTCTAGMLGSCNHIAGVLFRMEHAVKTGMTKPASTSQLCEWTIPKKKTKINPKKVSDFVWKKSHYNKSQIDLNKEYEMSAKKSGFTPLSKSQETQIKDESKIRQNLHTLLKSEMPNSCFTLLMDKRRIETEEKEVDVPYTLTEIAASIPKNGVTLNEQKALLMSKLKMTEEQRESLMKVTLNQSESSEWKKHRCGRVTASLFHRLCLRAKSLRRDKSQDPTSVINAVMKDQPCIQTKAMKHGISMEPVAKRAYMCVMKSGHKIFKGTECGLVVHKEKSFVAASPDLFVECKCCGEGLCEIKCPESIKDQKPSVDNVPYLNIDKEGTVSVKKNHPYYYQMQGQMGITERKYCDLFVFTHHGHICTRIQFDQDVFDDIMKEITWFWESYIMDELLTRDTRVLKEKITNLKLKLASSELSVTA